MTFAAAGSLREAYERVDWAATSLGPTSSWSPTLLGVLDLLHRTRFPMTLVWGPEGLMLYNEAYVELIEQKHPTALGAPVQEVFPEAWHQVGPLLEQARSGEAVYLEDALVPLWRQGFLEECYFTFSYSSVHAPDGTVEGVVDVSHETTRHVLDRRRLALLSRLGRERRTCRTPRRCRPARWPCCAPTPTTCPRSTCGSPVPRACSATPGCRCGPACR
ncbi:hypothetical protein GCM10025868_18960 [Angustibacter aerolatus]|uniref:PAS fold-4 domain-containing protein n=1 Tax=Angustibacter aerolatus TaxID=1162965 RepID=A0ABQ6JIN9_9ACTN|nr:PAS domain-containing protein [Angustibacter aerolatus]GMA86646.1 hypothetical protein GCM10025868_18960 [Angustibacter aerolatus]